MIKYLFLFFFIGFLGHLNAQREPDKLYSTTVKTVKLFPQNNQLALPIINLNSGDQLELHFDDLAAIPANYYYTYQLCNADWSEAQWSPFDYIRGFQQNRINTYRVASITRIPYVHYQALLPERNAMPSRSGNYLLKVYKDADTSKLIFTKRFFVVDNNSIIAARVEQPFDNQLMRTHQKIQLAIDVQGLNAFSPQQFNTVILQNGRWDNAVKNIQPSFIRGNVLEFNPELDCIFPAGKEYRWADLRSFRFESDRVEKIDQTTLPVEVLIRPDIVRSSLRYLFYRDQNGFSNISSSESLNPWWQTEYGWVTFRFQPDKGLPLVGKNVYILGEFTGNQINDTSLMKFDAETGMYTKKIFLKNGYYNYQYVTQEAKGVKQKSDPALTEGNYWETENEYSIFFYYRPFGARHDELIGYRLVRNGL
ncbi:MAG: DUF5103 domain-containing protein [Sediminibacterium sp.]|nr:DUF5103 domain-containing protein [Sediminibacterium sp.]